MSPQSALLYPYSSTSIMATLNTDGEVAATVAITDAISGARCNQASFDRNYPGTVQINIAAR